MGRDAGEAIRAGWHSVRSARHLDLPSRARDSYGCRHGRGLAHAPRALAEGSSLRRRSAACWLGRAGARRSLRACVREDALHPAGRAPPDPAARVEHRDRPRALRDRSARRRTRLLLRSIRVCAPGPRLVLDRGAARPRGRSGMGVGGPAGRGRDAGQAQLHGRLRPRPRPLAGPRPMAPEGRRHTGGAGVPGRGRGHPRRPGVGPGRPAVPAAPRAPRGDGVLLGAVADAASSSFSRSPFPCASRSPAGRPLGATAR